LFILFRRNVVIAIILVILPFLIKCSLQKKAAIGSEYPVNYRVIATSGLILRKSCSQNSKQVYLLPLLSTFTVTGVDRLEKIEEISGRWFYGYHKGMHGCVFGGYLYKVSPRNSYEQDTQMYSILLLILEKKYDFSLNKIERILQKDPTNGDALYYKAEIEYRQGKYKNCLNTLDKSIQYSNLFTIQYQLRGLCHQNLGNKDQAEINFKYANMIGNSLAYSYFNSVCTSKKVTLTQIQQANCDRHRELYPKFQENERIN